MATRYSPKNPTVSIVNGTDVTNPLYIPRYTLQLVPDSARPDPPVVIRDSARAASILRPLFHGLDREQFLVACLDAKHAIIGVNVVSIGSLTFSIVHPREVFKPAILLNSAAIICPTIILAGIRSPAQKIVCSPPYSVRPVTSSASPSSTILFWAMSVPTAFQIWVGQREVSQNKTAGWQLFETVNFYCAEGQWSWADTEEVLQRPNLVNGWMRYPQPAMLARRE